MGGIIKLIAENAILSLKMFDNVLLNLIVLALIWKYSYVPAWKVTKILYDKKIIKKKDSGKSSHWLIRGLATYIIFWLIKIPLVLAIYIENDIIQGFILFVLMIGIYYAVKYYKRESKLIKKFE